MRWLSEFLITVSGANRAILDQVPGERTKQVALGGAVVMTAVLAALSAGVALHMAFDWPWWLAVPGAVGWGIAILNLDRWLIVSTPRLKRWYATLALALPRVALAVVIGAVVSTPLTLQIFHDEIDEHLAVQHRADLAAYEQALQEDPRYTNLEADEQRIRELQDLVNTRSTDAIVLNDPAVKDLREQLAAVDAEFQQAEKDVACEKEGTCGSGRAGVGPAAADKEARRDRLAAERQALTDQLAAKQVEVSATAAEELQARISDAEDELATLEEDVRETEAARDEEAAAHAAAVAADDGLLARYGALREMEEDGSRLAEIHLGLFVFLTCMEIVPIVFKTLLSLAKPSLYEWMAIKEAERVEDRVYLRHETEYDEATILAQSRLDAAKARAATELDAEIRAAHAVLDAQVDLAEAAVNRWREEQEGKIADEVSQWLKANDGRFGSSMG
ncbi:DUF4407 domain-containing protein [Kineococcus arenarius]|uniref:DUF4407 domain-containing protein n=1 Tax=Kineococcus sp. SYSU DK007 TaxID=3383128 RepID=UPI003D7F1023